MQPGERFPFYFKILLPLLALIALQVSPESRAVRGDFEVAQVARQGGLHLPAAQALRRVVEREPWRIELWEQIGSEEYAAGRTDSAVPALLTASAFHSLSPEGRFLLAEAYAQQHKTAEAEAAWQSLLDNFGPDARVYERLVQSQRSRGSYAEAAGTLRAWHTLAPDDARVSFLLGLHLSVVDPKAALPALLEAARQDASYSGLVQSLRAGLDLAAASDQPAYGRLMIGRSLGSIDQWDLAAEAFRQAVEAAPQYAEAWAFLGEARAQLGSSGKAELDKARALGPQSPVVNALYALYLRRQGKYQEALRYLEAIAAQEPQEPTWQVEIGNTYVDLGELMTARSHFEKAVELAPGSSPYWQYLARFSVDYNVDIRGLALPAARKAVLLAPDDPGALDTMGWTLANLGDGISAERFLQRSLARDATYAPACLHLGQLYLQQQNSEGAYFYLKQAESLAGASPAGQTAQRLLQRYFGDGG